MGPDNIKLSIGNLYIQELDGLEQIVEIGECVEAVEAVEPELAEDAEPVLRIGKAIEEVTLSLELVGEAAQQAATSLAKTVRSLILCMAPAFDNKRVVHLARYGSTQRIREKNRRRLINIIIKEAKK